MAEMYMYNFCLVWGVQFKGMCRSHLTCRHCSCHWKKPNNNNNNNNNNINILDFWKLGKLSNSIPR